MAKSIKKETIILLGASSYIGRHILQNESWTCMFKIKAVSRLGAVGEQIQALNQKTEFITTDLTDYQAVQKLLTPGSIVINLAYSWLGGEEENLRMINNIIEVGKSKKIKRLVHCSTAAVVGRASDEMVTETSPCFPKTEYGITKLKIEKILLDRSQKYFDVVILRPTSVFGPDGEPLKKLAREIMHGNRIKNYLKYCLFGSRRMNLVPINNVIDAIMFIVKNANDLKGQTYIVSNDDAPENNFIYISRFLMEKFNIQKYLIPKIPLPLGLLEFLLLVLGRNNINPRCNYSSEKIQKLGFSPKGTFQTALNEYAEWYLDSHSK